MKVIQKRLTALIAAVLLAGSSGRCVSAQETGSAQRRQSVQATAGQSMLGVVGMGLVCAGGLVMLITGGDRKRESGEEKKRPP